MIALKHIYSLNQWMCHRVFSVLMGLPEIFCATNLASNFNVRSLNDKNESEESNHHTFTHRTSLIVRALFTNVTVNRWYRSRLGPSWLGQCPGLNISHVSGGFHWNRLEARALTWHQWTSLYVPMHNNRPQSRKIKKPHCLGRPTAHRRVVHVCCFGDLNGSSQNAGPRRN